MTIEEIKNIANNRENFEKLVDLCIGEYVVPYIGAGLSDFANRKAGFSDKFYTWWKYLSIHYYDCFYEKLENDADLYKTADQIEESGKERFYENIRTTYGYYLSDNEWEIILEKSKDEAISVIPKLFNGPIITTNFDQILEKVHNSALSVYLPHDIDALKNLKNVVKARKHSIYKVHGSVSDVNKIVFTGKSYDKAYQSNSELVKTLSDFYKGFCFLFLGSSLKMSEKEIDRSIKLWTQLTNTGMSHFAILEYPDDLKTRQDELEKQNIKPIFFPKGRFDLIKTILSEILKRKESAFGKIPKYKSEFIGRKDILDTIEQHLRKSDYSAFALVDSAFALTGTGGVGKTRIMREYAYEKQGKQEYKRVVWFNAVSKAAIEIGLYQFAEGEELITKGAKEAPEKIFEKVKNWMIKNNDWLFLLDNVEDYKDIEKLLSIEANVPIKGKRHFIITSRKSKLPIPRKVIGVFEKSESQDFLFSYTKLEPDNYSEKIADKLGYLPLALEQAAAYIKKIRQSNHKFNYKSYLLELENSFEILKKGDTESRTLSIEATWNISMRMIENEESKQLLNLCSFFAPDNIDCKWFRDANNQLQSYPELQLKFQNKIEYPALLEELSEYSLVYLTNENISTHRLTQDAVKRALSHDEQVKCLKTCVLLMDALRFNIIPSAESRLRFNQMASHINTLLESTILVESKEVANLNSFLGNGVRELFADYQAALNYHTISLTILTKIFGDKTIETALANHNVGRDLYEQGDYPACLEYYIKARDIREEQLDCNDIDISKSNNDLGLAYHKIGDYDAALRCYNRALEIKEFIFGKEHSETASLYNNIGLVHYRQGDCDKALYFNQKALNIRIEEFGIENVYVAISHNDIGVIYCEQGCYKKALNSFRNALAIWRIVYGHKQEHSDIAMSYNNIGFVLIKLGQYERALDKLFIALEMRKRILKEDHPYTAKTQNNIGLAYLLQGDYERALDFFLDAYFIQEKRLAKNHADTANTLSNMRDAYERTNTLIPFDNWLDSKRVQR